MAEFSEVVITGPDPGWLYAFARSLVADGLAAGAHNFTPVQSIYTWVAHPRFRLIPRSGLRMEAT